MYGGNRAVIFNKFSGVQNKVKGEGIHFKIPVIQEPVIFDVKTRPRSIPTITGTKGIA